ncbi:MAG: hypothetical protein ABR501_13065 [Pyrinomonadaceae bacterium]
MSTTTVNRASGSTGPPHSREQRVNSGLPFRHYFSPQITPYGTVPLLLVAFVVLVVTSATGVSAQTLRVRLAVNSIEPAKVQIEAEGFTGSTTLSFPNTYGGVLGLGQRIENLDAMDARGHVIPVRKLATGEFQTTVPFTRLKYDVNLTEPRRAADMSHVSWLNKQHGLLMLSDLLPQPTGSSATLLTIAVQLEVPAGWTVFSNLKNQDSQYFTANADKAVFLIGSSLHQKSRRFGSTDFSICTSGAWPFTEDEIFKIIEPILKRYSRITGSKLKGNAALMLVPYAGDAGPSKWSAETRDNAVVLLLGRRATGGYVLAQLAIVLSHELFHRWVPGALNLQGDYDWFFEGFTLYEALRMNLHLGLISFQDYLNTLARVYESYLNSVNRDALSLLAASERRWTTSSSLVYEKGMLVAFLYDLAVRQQRGCKASIGDLYKQLFQLKRAGQQSANETIIRLMSNNGEMKSFVESYIQGSDRVDLDPLLSLFGLRLQRGSGALRIDIGNDISKEQKKLLGCLGLENLKYLPLRIPKN